MKKAMICGAVMAIFIAARAMAADPCTDPLTTGQGQVSGLSEKDQFNLLSEKFGHLRKLKKAARVA